MSAYMLCRDGGKGRQSIHDRVGNAGVDSSETRPGESLARQARRAPVHGRRMYDIVVVVVVIVIADCRDNKLPVLCGQSVVASLRQTLCAASGTFPVPVVQASPEALEGGRAGGGHSGR